MVLSTADAQVFSFKCMDRDQENFELHGDIIINEKNLNKYLVVHSLKIHQTPVSNINVIKNLSFIDKDFSFDFSSDDLIVKAKTKFNADIFGVYSGQVEINKALFSLYCYM